MQNPIQKFENFDELQLPCSSLLFADFIIILILITARVKTYFHLPIFTMWQVKDYKEGNNFILRKLEMPHSHAKMQLKIATQKLNFAKVKAISKNYTLDCSCKLSCKFPHSCA